MKTFFEEPKLEMIRFSSENILSTSGGGAGVPDGSDVEDRLPLA